MDSTTTAAAEPQAQVVPEPKAPPKGQPFTLGAAIRYGWPDLKTAPHQLITTVSAERKPLLIAAGYILED